MSSAALLRTVAARLAQTQRLVWRSFPATARRLKTPDQQQRHHTKNSIRFYHGSSNLSRSRNRDDYDNDFLDLEFLSDMPDTPKRSKHRKKRKRSAAATGKQRSSSSVRRMRDGDVDDYVQFLDLGERLFGMPSSAPEQSRRRTQQKKSQHQRVQQKQEDYTGTTLPSVIQQKQNNNELSMVEDFFDSSDSDDDDDDDEFGLSMYDEMDFFSVGGLTNSNNNTRSQALQQATACLQADSDVRNALGGRVMVGQPFQESSNIMNGQSSTELVFPVQGSYGRGTARLLCSSSDGLNTVLDELEVQCEDGRTFQVGTTQGKRGGDMFDSGDEEIIEAEIIEKTEEKVY